MGVALAMVVQPATIVSSPQQVPGDCPPLVQAAAAAAEGALEGLWIMDAVPRDRRASGHPSVTGIEGVRGGRWSLKRSTGDAARYPPRQQLTNRCTATVHHPCTATAFPPPPSAAVRRVVRSPPCRHRSRCGRCRQAWCRMVRQGGIGRRSLLFCCISLVL